ncbi:B-cell receptor-associated 31-like protein [Nadsonia fulvescens var. elongata DSM 6958]|uniref:Endoplasmic reticulum transmembrane protein n=1 Tax=Nadsonia fulvescens var. elongata DSM 6958 TaxID=857566 RepID=A0A1E3PHS3_9ASCO|nr:B-cell receptor-associated 31-like protein [Nadsonia fulvescens var. elongata DSM 6958]
MTLYYTLVFLILIFEMLFFLILVTPLPYRIRRNLMLCLSQINQFDKLILGLKFTFVFILILFIDSVNRVYSVQQDFYTAGEAGGAVGVGNAATAGAGFINADRSEIQARKFYAQRNMYLCGFTLFLTLILNRTYVMVFELLELKEQHKALKDGSNQAVGDDTIAKANEEKLEKLTQDRIKKDKELSALKSQSESLGKEYERVSDELNSKQGVTLGDKKKD